jgi:C-methyltransferase-like protein/methyltransferase family protein/putative zinc binding protein
MYAPHIDCRACGSHDLRRYLDLGLQAPANALTGTFKAPLSIAWCGACCLSQLEQVVDPKVLYQHDYPFRAGASTKWRLHCAKLVESLSRDYALDCGAEGEAVPSGLWLDIGANDGTLLETAQTAGWTVLGVDPGPPRTTVPILQEFWGTAITSGLRKFHGPARIITATNVFGHVDNALDFLIAARDILSPLGTLVIECPHIIPLLDAVAFDTIYHEHLSYWSLGPLELLAHRAGLKVVSAEWFHELHGGTARYTLVPSGARRRPDSTITGLRILENGLRLRGFAPYQEFAQKATAEIAAFRARLLDARAAGQRIVGYGANAKAAVRLQAADLTRETIDAVVDDGSAKWGYAIPGTDIPIIPVGSLASVGLLVLFSWNNAVELLAKANDAGFKGEVLVPIPIRQVA